MKKPLLTLALAALASHAWGYHKHAGGKPTASLTVAKGCSAQVTTGSGTGKLAGLSNATVKGGQTLTGTLCESDPANCQITIDRDTFRINGSETIVRGDGKNCRMMTITSPCGPGDELKWSGISNYPGCPSCRPGTFNGAGGLMGHSAALDCQACPAGTASRATGAKSCKACPAGTYQPGMGQTECIRCPKKKTSPEGSTDAAACK